MCGFSEGLQENWLIIQHINTVLPGGERLRKVTAQFEGTLNGCDISRQCRQSFEVHKWLTFTIDRSAAANTDNYISVNRVSPEFTDGIMSFVEYLLDAEDGFYLAVVDRSTCIVLMRLLVFYYVCPEEMSELISCLCNPGYEKSQDQCSGVVNSNIVYPPYSILSLRVSRRYILSWSQ